MSTVFALRGTWFFKDMLLYKFYMFNRDIINWFGIYKKFIFYPYGISSNTGICILGIPLTSQILVIHHIRSLDVIVTKQTLKLGFKLSQPNLNYVD